MSMAFASKKPFSLKSDKKILVPDPVNTSRQSTALKYLPPRKLATGKTSERISKQPKTPTPRVFPRKLNSNQSSKEPLKDVVKNNDVIKNTKHTINTTEVKPVINTRDVLKRYSRDLKENNEQVIVSNVETKNKPFFCYGPKQSKNIVLHSCSEQYIPKKFSVKVTQPIAKDKTAIKEIQKNLNSWRKQKETKNHEHNTKKFPSDSKRLSIFTGIDKFSSEKATHGDVESLYKNKNTKSSQISSIDESKNSIEMKCFNLSTSNIEQTDVYNHTCEKHIDPCKNTTMQNVSVQVNQNEELNFKFKDTTLEFKQNSCEDSVKNINNSITFDDTVVLTRVKCNTSNDENTKENENCQINSNVHNSRYQDTFINSSCSDKSNKGANDVHKSNTCVNSETTTALKKQSESLPRDSIVKKHKESILVLVDNYFNKTKSNNNLSIHNFMKYLLNKTLETKDFEEQLIEKFNLEQKLNSSEEPPQSKEKSDVEKVLQKDIMNESSVTSTVKRKEKYSKKLNIQTFIYNNPPGYFNPTILSKKEKFKMLTLVNSHQHEKMCIHINYQSPSNPLDKKSKLSVYKESPINIRPQLTKHTFATATCTPQPHSSKPNIALQCLQHLDEGGCKEVKLNTEELTPDKKIYQNPENSSNKQIRIDLLIKELIRYTKLRMHLTNKMTSAVVEKLLTLQESICNFYSRQSANSFDMKNLSPESRELLTIIMMEIDNPERLDLNVKTNQNLKCILQRLVDTVQFENNKNACEDPPNSVNNYSIPAGHNLYEDISKKSCHVIFPMSKRSRVFKSSFGMRKNYMSKKIRPSMNKELNLSEKKFYKCDDSIPDFNTEKPIYLATSKKKSELINLPKSKNDNKNDLSESDSSIQGFSSSEKRNNSDSGPISLALPEKSMNGMKITDVAGINMRLHDLKSGSGTEHYRISVKTDENSIIEGVQPELPCTMLDEVIYSRHSRNKCVLNVKKSSITDAHGDGETNLQAGKVNCANGNKTDFNTRGVFNDMCEKLNDILKYPKSTMKSRNNYTKIDRSFGLGELQCLSRPDISLNSSKNQVGCQGFIAHKNELLPEKNCGDSNVIIMNVSNSSKQNELNTTHKKINIGVNTDVSLLENLLKSLHKNNSEDSYACDLSMCCSTTGNEQSEGEIGFYAYESNNYTTSQLSSECKFSCYPCQSMRNIRMFNIQQTADIFLI